MQVLFYKYQGTGNDFIMIDNREMSLTIHKNFTFIEKLCHRRFGIGADGLILLEKSSVADFKMVYFNADGHPSTMCGNGGRCIVSFARFLSIFDHTTTFEAIDGLHHASVREDDLISLGMNDVSYIQNVADKSFVLNTGSPHYVQLENSMPENIYESGRKIRYSEAYIQDGINVNFVVEDNGILQVCTYERGVEDETYSCGTGVVASAIASLVHQPAGKYQVNIRTKGGNLTVVVEKMDTDTYQNIQLTGPVVQVFKGYFEI